MKTGVQAAKRKAESECAAEVDASDEQDVPKRQKMQDALTEVLCFGSNDMGQLGLGPGVQERRNPGVVKSLENFKPVAVRERCDYFALIVSNTIVRVLLPRDPERRWPAVRCTTRSRWTTEMC